MAAKYKSPVSGFPRTTKYLDPNGNPVYTVTPRFFTPLRAKIRDHCIKAGWWIMALTCLYCIADANKISDGDLGRLAMQTCAYALVLTLLIYYTARRKERLVISADALCVRRWYGWQRFDRAESHMFFATHHDRAQKEAEDHADKMYEAAQKGKKLRLKPYYQKSFHVAVNYGGQRRDLLSVYGEKDTEAILGRLQYCDQQIEEAMSKRGGASGHTGGGSTHGPGGV